MVPTESELETRFAQLVQATGLPEPVRQHVVLDADRFVARVDFAYPEARTAIELDGFSTHGNQGAFIADRRRQNSLVALGWTVLRFTWNDLADRPGDVVRTVCAAGRVSPAVPMRHAAGG
jgi:very-short-patch-repair endonuclease